MKPFVLMRGAWIALLKNKKRSFLTMIGIVIGIAAVSTIVSIGRGFERYVTDSLNPDDGELLTVDIWFQSTNLEWANETSEDIFSDYDIHLVESIEGIEEVTIPTYEFDSTSEDVLMENETTHEIIEFVDDQGSPVIAGRSLDLMDSYTHSRSVVVPLTLAEEWAEDIESVIGRGLSLKDQKFTIVGVYEAIGESDDVFGGLFETNGIEMPRATYLHYYEEEEDNSELEVTLTQGYLPSEVAEEAVEVLEENGSMRQRGEYEYFDLSAIDDGLALVLRGITLFIASIAGISLLIAGIGVMNMMYISVSERTKEIGIRRAMGAKQKTIRLQFVLEGVMMTSIGGVFGYVLGLLFSGIASLFLPFSVGVDLVTVAIALGISGLIGLIFSYSPANAASKKEIIDIL